MSWKRRVGVGVGAGLLGAALVSLRFRARPEPRPSLPDIISPSIFARRVQRTTRGQMVYHASGSGEPIIFLHDFFPGAASYEWSKVYPAFAASHRVLVPDWIGFGESERPDRLLRAEDHAQSLHEFARATCAGRRPVLVGSGVGAALACLASAQHPEFAARMILFAPAGTAGRVREWVTPALRPAALLRRGRRWIYRSMLSSPASIARWLQGRRSPGAALDLDEAVAVFSTFARQYGAEWAIKRMISGRFALPALPRIEETLIPVTIWWPGNPDGPATWAGAERPGVRLEVLEDCGPLAPLDRPGELVSLLQAELFHPVRLA